jgi:hypothetical protein
MNLSTVFHLAGMPVIQFLLFFGLAVVVGIFYFAYGMYAWVITFILYFSLKIVVPPFRRAIKSMHGLYRFLIIANVASIILFVDLFTGRPILMNTVGKIVPEEYHVRILEGEYEYLCEYTEKGHLLDATKVGDPYMSNTYLMSPLNMHYKLRFYSETGIRDYSKYFFELDDEKINRFKQRYPHLRYTHR